VALALFALAAAVLRRPGWILEALLAARDAGVAGRVLFGLVYLVAALLMLPVSPITLGAGHAFGPLVGVLVASPATCLAACLPFFLGRTLARGVVTRQLGRVRGFPVMAEAIRRSGLRMVILMRLSPVVPFPVLNYLLGVSPLRASHFAAGSFLGMLPGTILYAWLGSLIPDARQAVEGAGPRLLPGASWALLAVGAALTVATTVLARRALQRALDQARAEAAPAAAARAVGDPRPSPPPRA
jgi:uncharacterized membrane protein YdjX (TVP38/TMEM64 family)